MRALLVLMSVSLLLSAVLSLAGCGGRRVDAGFATKATVKYHYDRRAIDSTVTDPQDLKALKGIFAGGAKREYLSLMFDPSVSITLTDGQRSITFCPSYGGEPIIEIFDVDQSSGRTRDTGCYLTLSNEQNRLLHTIVKKYGMILPVE